MSERLFENLDRIANQIDRLRDKLGEIPKDDAKMILDIARTCKEIQDNDGTVSLEEIVRIMEISFYAGVVVGMERERARRADA